MIGERLRQARLAAGLTLEEVSQRLGRAGTSITRAALCKYEMSKSVPGPSLLLKLGRALGVRAGFFLSEPTIAVEWKESLARTGRDRARADQLRAASIERVESYCWLQELLSPGLRPVFATPKAARKPEDAETLAASLRKAWSIGDGAIANLAWAIEDHGGIVLEMRADCGDPEILTGWVRSKQSLPLLLVNSSLSYFERHYNLARGLGRLLLLADDGLSVRDYGELVRHFADALLVPPGAARRELGAKRRRLDHVELENLNHKYGLPGTDDWIKRALFLGIVEPGHARTLARDRRERVLMKFGANVSFAFVGEEKPTRFLQMVWRALAENMITEQKAWGLLPECFSRPTTEPEPAEAQHESAREFVRKPKEERGRLLAAAAADAAESYRTDPRITAFEAFGEEDLYDSDGGNRAEPRGSLVGKV